MRPTWIAIAGVLSMLALIVLGCESAGGGGGSDTAPDVAADVAFDSGGQDAPPIDTTAPPDTPAPADVLPPPDTPAPEDVPELADTAPPGPYGFRIRTPDPAAHTCADDPWNDGQMGDVDHVCTFAHGELDGFVYLQATPVGCESVGMSYAPVYATEARISLDGVVSSLQDPSYDHGGNHNNDAAEFTHAGTRYRLWHSSFGFGWRRCQPMDCVYVLAAGGAIAEDGCDPVRTLPVTCDAITPDHLVPDLTDDFALCPGDDGT